MKLSRAILLAALALLVVSGMRSAAQSKNMTAEEQRNLQHSLDWWRVGIEANHMEVAPKYLTERYIQHNPNFTTGREGLVKAFSVRPPRPIQDKLERPPKIAFAKGDYVVFLFEREEKDPADPTTVSRYSFWDIYRIENGMIDEHWDSVWKNAPRPGDPPVIPGVGPAFKAPRNTPEEAQNEAVALRFYKDVLQYGHAELIPQLVAAGYVDHSPDGPGGRDGLTKKIGSGSQPIKPEWKDKPTLVVTSGDIVQLMFERWSVDPADPSKSYVWNWFDAFRVGNGQVQEHWDMARKTVKPPATVPPPSRKS